jgi:hypothetical protein
MQQRSSLLFPARGGRLIKLIELGLEFVKPVHRFPSRLRSLGAANPSNGNAARPFPRMLHTGEGAASALRIGQKLDMREAYLTIIFGGGQAKRDTRKLRFSVSRQSVRALAPRSRKSLLRTAGAQAS